MVLGSEPFRRFPDGRCHETPDLGDGGCYWASSDAHRVRSRGGRGFGARSRGGADTSTLGSPLARESRSWRRWLLLGFFRWPSCKVSGWRGFGARPCGGADTSTLGSALPRELRPRGRSLGWPSGRRGPEEGVGARFSGSPDLPRPRPTTPSGLGRRRRRLPPGFPPDFPTARDWVTTWTLRRAKDVFRHGRGSQTRGEGASRVSLPRPMKVASARMSLAKNFNLAMSIVSLSSRTIRFIVLRYLASACC